MRRRDINFGSEQQGAIEELTRGIVATIVQGPATVLEAASTEIETAAVLRMVHCIFDLECD
jgi:glutamyl-tRNA reductase